MTEASFDTEAAIGATHKTRDVFLKQHELYVKKRTTSADKNPSFIQMVQNGHFAELTAVAIPLLV